MNFPDGAPAVWRQRAGGCAAARRVAGTELMLSVIALGQDLDLRHFLYGSTPQVLDRLTRSLVAAFPRACVVGTLSPPFRQMSADEEKGLATEIRSTSPHIVWVGLGTPKQDLWMHHNAQHLGGALAMGVGAAFDFIGGTKRRAPAWMRDAGLEWLHRMCCEPRRLAPRYLDTNTRFVVYNLQHAVQGRRRGRLHSGR
jgi:N-acetylglucosaminyldiphosphoundecaprenol N-acetyl-beta-D-mannosaminyltransferase